MESVDLLKQICRLCAKEDRYCIGVFSEDGNKNNISKKIRLCLPITIKEDDDYPKQVCLTCLNKLDTSYELYSGCMNAQSTIKKLIKMMTENRANIEEPRVELLVESPPLEQPNLIALQQSKLSRSKPYMKIGKTVVKLQESNIEKLSSDPGDEPRLKVRRLQEEREESPNSTHGDDAVKDDDDDDGDDAVKDDDDDDDDGGGGGGDDHFDTAVSPLQSDSLKENETVDTSKQVLPHQESSYTAKATDQIPLMFVTDNVNIASLPQQQFGTYTISAVTTESPSSSVGHPIGNVPIYTMAATINENRSSTQQTSVPVKLRNILPRNSQNSPVQQQVLIPMYNSSPTGNKEMQIQHLQRNEQQDIEDSVPAFITTPAGQLALVNTNSQKQKVAPRVPAAKQSVENTTEISYNVKQKGPLNVVTSHPSVKKSVLKQNQVSVTATPSLQVVNFEIMSHDSQKTGAETGVVNSVRKKSRIHIENNNLSAKKLDSPYLNQTSKIMSSKDIQNGSMQDKITLSAHPVSCVCHSCQQARSLSAVTTFTTNVTTVTTTTFTGRSKSLVTNANTPSATTIISAGSPVISTGISNSQSKKQQNVELPARNPNSIRTISESTVSISESLFPSSSNNKFNSSSVSETNVGSTVSPTINRTTIASAAIKRKSQESPMGGSASTRNVTTTSATVTKSSISTASTLSIDTISLSSNGSDKSSKNSNPNFCQYCKKIFPENIIVHHRTLHFRERFFCCVSCGKNFRTEVGLEHHRCEDSETGHPASCSCNACLQVQSGSAGKGPANILDSSMHTLIENLLADSPCSVGNPGAKSVSRAEDVTLVSSGNRIVNSISSTCAGGTITSSSINKTIATPTGAVKGQSLNARNITKITNTTSTARSVPIASSKMTSAPPAAKNNLTSNVSKNHNRHRCQYCGKVFESHIIEHHRKLHFRERFFCCIFCGKNFRTEVGLEAHKCEDPKE